MHIGLDVGTSGTKACAFDEKGQLFAGAACDYDFSDTREGRREIRPESFSAAVLNTLAEVAGKLKAGGHPMPRSVTVSSLGEAVVPLDAQFKPLYNFIVGTDRRGEEESHAAGLLLGNQQIAHTAGVPTGGLYSYGKIAWLREHEPEIFFKAKLWLNVQDYVIKLLSGRALMDTSIASRTMMYDITENRWWKPILKTLDLSEDRLPCVCQAGTVADTLLQDIARRTGLPSSTLVVAGAHDHITNAVGCGVLQPGWSANATGTTEGITAVMNQRMNPEDIIRCNISCEPFVLLGQYCTVAWHNAAGVLLKWYSREFGRASDGDFSGMDTKCPPGPTRLLVLPHFSGGGTPDFDAASKGVIVGLTLGTTRYDLFKALMEGATYELRRILEAMRTCGLRADELVVCGGGANSPVWLQLKSDILNKEVRVPTRAHNGALGNSILGAVACGDFDNIFEAAEAMAGNRPAACPNPENARIYAELAEQYNQLYPALFRVNHQL